MDNSNQIKYDESGSNTTGKQWTALAIGLKCAYGNQNFLSDEYAMKFWYRMIRDIPYESLAIAVNKYIQTEHFPPTPADIRKLAAEVSGPELPDWSYGWAEVQKAIQMYGYNRYDEAVQMMNSITKETVDRIKWRTVCYDENQTAVRSNFRDIYTAIADRKKSDAALSQNLLRSIEDKRIQFQLEQKEQMMIGRGDAHG